MQLSNEGGEMHLKHEELAELVGQSRRNVIRVLEALVSKGLVTVGARYRWVLKVSSRGRPYRMKMRLPNVYRVATRFMTALKEAGKLIRRKVSQR
jgi:DNA-binding IclR family transcriptional regulator